MNTPTPNARARAIRLGVVRAALKSFINEEDALALLRQPLSAKDETPVDDSGLLHASKEEISKALGIPFNR